MQTLKPLIFLLYRMFLALIQADPHVIESYVRRYPDHWFWLHRRWKQR